MRSTFSTFRKRLKRVWRARIPDQQPGQNKNDDAVLIEEDLPWPVMKQQNYSESNLQQSIRRRTNPRQRNAFSIGMYDDLADSSTIHPLKSSFQQDLQEVNNDQEASVHPRDIGHPDPLSSNPLQLSLADDCNRVNEDGTSHTGGTRFSFSPLSPRIKQSFISVPTYGSAISTASSSLSEYSLQTSRASSSETLANIHDDPEAPRQAREVHLPKLISSQRIIDIIGRNPFRSLRLNSAMETFTALSGSPSKEEFQRTGSGDQDENLRYCSSPFGSNTPTSFSISIPVQFPNVLYNEEPKSVPGPDLSSTASSTVFDAESSSGLAEQADQPHIFWENSFNLQSSLTSDTIHRRSRTLFQECVKALVANEVFEAQGMLTGTWIPHLHDTGQWKKGLQQKRKRYRES